MKKLFFLLLPFWLFCVTGYGTTYNVTSPGFTFSPDSFSAHTGDTVVFTLQSFHFVTEVDQSTWIANGSASNGGFSTPNGGGMVILDQPKMYYYVCGVHFSSGMKGRISVTDPSGINTPTNHSFTLTFSQDPDTKQAKVITDLPAGKEKEMKIFDITGKSVLVKQEIAPVEFLDLSRFPAGIYFIEVKAEGVLLQKKFIIPKS